MTGWIQELPTALHGWTGSYGWAILALTLGIRLLLLPLQVWQQRATALPVCRRTAPGCGLTVARSIKLPPTTRACSVIHTTPLRPKRPPGDQAVLRVLRLVQAPAGQSGDDFALLREAAQFLLGKDIRTVERHFEDAARRRHEREFGNGVLVLVQQLFHQTGGLWQEASARAVLDRNSGLLHVRGTLPCANGQRKQAPLILSPNARLRSRMDGKFRV